MIRCMWGVHTEVCECSVMCLCEGVCVVNVWSVVKAVPKSQIDSLTPGLVRSKAAIA